MAIFADLDVLVCLLPVVWPDLVAWMEVIVPIFDILRFRVVCSIVLGHVMYTPLIGTHTLELVTASDTSLVHGLLGVWSLAKIEEGFDLLVKMKPSRQCLGLGWC